MNTMKEQTFGVEIEMNEITRARAAKVAAKFFGTNNYKDTNSVNGYCTYSAWDAQGREWKFQKDVSIDGDAAHKCEMVTPILKYEDMETLQELVRQLRHAGAKSDATRGCGVHIHIGADGHNATTLRNLVNMMYNHEDVITKALWLGRNRVHTYCKPVNKTFLTRLNNEKPATMTALADIWYEGNHASYGRTAHYNDSRYHMLNLHATFTKGTIEFRLFQFDKPGRVYKGGLHAGKLKAYILFCLALSDKAKNVINTVPFKVQTDNEKAEMNRWLCWLGLDGDENVWTRRTFTEHLDGDLGDNTNAA